MEARNWETITEKEFASYEEVRKSGVTNMLNGQMVSALSGLDGSTIVTIISYYKQLMDKYPGVRR